MKKESKQIILDILKLAFPMMVQNLLNNVVGLMDTAMISTIGENAISGVAVANKVLFIYNLVIYGLSNGFGIYINQYSKKNDNKNLSDIFNESIRDIVGVALVFSVVMFAFRSEIIRIYVKNPEVIEIGTTYLGIVILSLALFSCTSMHAVLLRAIGYAQYPTIASVCSVFTNLVLNAVLIFGLFGFPQLGITGAAIATVTSRVVEMLMTCYFAYGKAKKVKLQLKVEMAWSTKKEILKRAFTLMANELFWSLGMNAVFIAYSHAGEQFIPAVTVVDNINNILYLMITGYCAACGIYIGQTLGKGDKQLCRQQAKVCLVTGFVINAIGGLAIILTRPVSVQLFKLGAENLQMAKNLLFVKGCVFAGKGLADVAYYIVRAGGDTKGVIYIDSVFTWCGPVLFSFIAANILHFGILQTYIIAEGIVYLQCVNSLLYLKKETWLENLTEKNVE